MKLQYNPSLPARLVYPHSRSETEISIASNALGAVVICFLNADLVESKLELESENDFLELKKVVLDVKAKLQGDNNVIDGDQVELKITRDTWGEPFHECVQFMFTVKNPLVPLWDREYMSASLSFRDIDSFISGIEKRFELYKRHFDL